MTIGERIKKLRKEKKLTQQALAERIGIKQNSLTLLETGRNNPSTQTILSICREFRVNEQWLREGEGEMYVACHETLLAEVTAEYGLNEEQQELIAAFMELSDIERQAIVTAAMKAAERVRAKRAEMAKLNAEAEKWRAEQYALEAKYYTKPDGLSDEEWEIIRQLRAEKDTSTSADLPCIA